MVKTALEKVVPPVVEVNIRGKVYSLQRLTLRGVFRLGAVFSKVAVVLDLPKVLSLVEDEGLSKAEKEAQYLALASQVIAVLPLCEEEVYGFIQSLLVDQGGGHPTLEEVKELPCDELLELLETFVKVEDLGGILKRFFGIATKTLEGTSG